MIFISEDKSGFLKVLFISIWMMDERVFKILDICNLEISFVLTNQNIDYVRKMFDWIFALVSNV